MEGIVSLAGRLKARSLPRKASTVGTVWWLMPMEGEMRAKETPLRA
jgi:hypothetical protein